MTRYDIKILELVVLRGPNRWSYKPTLEALVDIGLLEECPSNSLPGFVERLIEWLPGLHQHECSYEVPGGFVRRLQEGTWVGHILEHVTLELQPRIGHPAGFGRARGAGATGVYHVVVRITQEDLTRACLLKARELILAAIHAEPFDVPGSLRTLRMLAQSKALGPSTACIVEAARAARIPVAPLEHGNLVLLGQSARQRRIWTAETDSTSAIAESIAKDKDLTKELLSNCGLPVPEGQIVRTLAEAWLAAEEIGVPVVLKPAEGSRGEAVSLAVSTQTEIAAAFERAQQVQSAVIIERYVEGIEHRLLVVGERVVAATRAIQFTVTGNGHDTVCALMASTLGGRESDRWAAEALSDYPTVRRALDLQTLDPNSVPAAGCTVSLHRHAKLGEDVLALVHPDTITLALLAARIVGLDIAGIDIVAGNIEQPLASQQGAIIEVNAGPSLPTHLRHPDGTSNTAGHAVVRHLFPTGEDGRIPLVGITGCTDTTSVAQLLGYLLYLHGRAVGVACAAGIFLGQRCIRQGDGANWSAGQRVLINRTVDAAVIETSPTSLLREGLPYDRCLVGVLTSIEAPTEIVPFGVQNADQMAHVLRTQIDVVLSHGVAVLNADDPAVLALAQYSEGEVLLYSRDKTTCSAIQAALFKGARAVYVDGDALVFAQHNNAERRMLAPCVNAADCLPAAAAAWALGIPFDLIIGAIVGYPVALLDQRTATF